MLLICTIFLINGIILLKYLKNDQHEKYVRSKVTGLKNCI